MSAVGVDTGSDDGLPIGDDLPEGFGDDGKPVVDGQAAPDGQEAPEPPAPVTLESLTDEQIAQLPAASQKLARDLKADYTRKTQQLADDRRKLEEGGAYVDMAKEVERTFNEDGPAAARRLLTEMADQIAPAAADGSQGSPPPAPQGQGQIQQMYNEALAILQSPDAAPNEQVLARQVMGQLQMMAQMAGVIDQMKTASDQTSRAFANTEIDTTLHSLHSSAEYQGIEGDFDRFADTVLQTAKREGIPNLKTAAKLAYADERVKRAETVAARRTQQKGQLPDGDVTPTAAPTYREPAKTTEECFARAKARMAAR